jgi:hypothetical protein
VPNPLQITLDNLLRQNMAEGERNSVLPHHYLQLLQEIRQNGQEVQTDAVTLKTGG